MFQFEITKTSRIPLNAKECNNEKSDNNLV